VVWRALQRRLSLLRRSHGAGRSEVDYAGAIRRAEAVRMERWDAREVEWERFSRRQGRRVPMRGFVGTARYAGDLAPFVPALRLGTWVGVGDNCTFGQGWYEVLELEVKKGD
jgi:CRISPR/Cas system endoribonuclease Cas6 (RAMP superfamily)